MRRRDLVCDALIMLNLLMKHFSSLLNDNENISTGDGEPDTPIDEDGTNVSLSLFEEGPIAIAHLKNKKTEGADTLQSELFKYRH